MAGVETLLWPFLGFLTVAALVSWWQAAAAKRDVQAGESPHDHDGVRFKERQDEIARFTYSRVRRAVIFTALGLAVVVYLARVD
jgi:hypothetical protein